jgi:hypothetical protein
MLLLLKFKAIPAWHNFYIFAGEHKGATGQIFNVIYAYVANLLYVITACE